MAGQFGYMRLLLFAVASVMVASLRADAEVGVGSTRADVIAEHGEPRGSTKAGAREILTYPTGRIVLEQGKVVESSVPARVAEPAATPVPSEAAKLADRPAVNSVPEAVGIRNESIAEVNSTLTGQARAQRWYTNFEEAKAAATLGKKRLLVLFTGTDWCPPCKEFQAQVANNADFLKLTEPSFVLVKIDWLRNTPQPKAEAEQTARLRQQYGIATFPSLLVMAADGTQLMRVETQKPRAANGTADFYMQAVDEARIATRDGKPVKQSWFPF